MHSPLVIAIVTGFLVDTVTCAPQGPCCLDNKFSLTLLTTYTMKSNTTGIIVQQQSALQDTDYSRKLVRLVIFGESVFTPDYKFQVTIYNDYTNSKMYRIKDGVCTVQPTVDTPFPPCIPDHFKIGRRFTIGMGLSNKTLTSWIGTWDGAAVSIATDDSCAPISIEQVGMNEGIPFMVTGLFTNIQNGRLSSPDALDLPDTCKHVS